MHHLFYQFKWYMNNITHINNNKNENKKDSADEACVLKIMPNSVFNNKDSIVLGVDIHPSRHFKGIVFIIQIIFFLIVVAMFMMILVFFA